MSKILAIDDNSDNLIILKALIHDAFIESVFYPALNGPTGIELAIEVDPDVILMDIVMPEMDGSDSGVAAAGLTVVFNKAIQASVDYDARMNERLTSHAISGRVSYSW